MWSVMVMPVVIILVAIARPLVCAAVDRLSWGDRMVKLDYALIASIVASKIRGRKSGAGSLSGQSQSREMRGEG
jgi:hypothetical protein